MDSLPSVSPSMVLPPTNPFRRHTRRLSLFSRHLPPRLFSTPRVRTNRRKEVSCNVVGGGGADDGGNEEEVEKALHMDGKIPGSSDEFLKQVSSRAYDMRRNLHQSFDSSSYDVLDDNPWRETSKPVYVLTQKENQLCTMKTRRNISEVERELGLLFSKGSNRRAAIENQSKQARGGTKFPMQVEDIRDGVLVCTLFRHAYTHKIINKRWIFTVIQTFCNVKYIRKYQRTYFSASIVFEHNWNLIGLVNANQDAIYKLPRLVFRSIPTTLNCKFVHGTLVLTTW
ncbi:plant/M4I22-120 protein, putative [Medicago truncatula]|uniref:Plant/M4I22-120 protein, putative n=1 Tax=Medicago truncatula TaxID=3880 RepID=A0A072UEJ8_MEDTR|nr:plant/M4I22-120 protein, putative [Medicago truncatula]